METSDDERRAGLNYLLKYKSLQSALEEAFEETYYWESAECILAISFILKQQKPINVNISNLRGGILLQNIIHNAQMIESHGMNSLELVKLLIDAGADKDLNSEDSASALHWAASGDAKLGILDYLLSIGADPHVKDKDGKTPYMWALQIDNRGALSVFHKHGITK